jgi:hypothetical protein
MAVTNYDVNTQLTLATTAEHEGDLDMALEFLVEAHRLAQEGDRITYARVYWATTRFHTRNLGTLPLVKQLSLSLLAAAY